MLYFQRIKRNDKCLKQKNIEYHYLVGYNNTAGRRSKKKKSTFIHLIPYTYTTFSPFFIPFNYCLIASKHNAIKEGSINISWMKRIVFISSSVFSSPLFSLVRCDKMTDQLFIVPHFSINENDYNYKP